MKAFNVSGEWKNFVFKTCQEEDFPAVLQHLRESFYKDEPINAIVGVDGARMNDLDARIMLFLEQKMTFMAICKSTQKIAGVIINSSFSKSDVHRELEPTSPLTPIVRNFIKQLAEAADVFGKCGVDHYAEIFIVSVLQEFRNCGLATEMYGRTVSVLKEMGYPLIECTFSNPFSRKLGDKFGFKELARKGFIDHKDEHGNQILSNASPDQFINCTVLDLRENK